MSVRCLCSLIWLACLPAGAQLHIVSIQVEPGRRILQNAGSHQQLLVLGNYEDGSECDLTPQAHWVVPKPGVVEITSGGLVKSVGDGIVTVTAEAEGYHAQAQFEVRGTGTPRTFEFAREIGGILTKKGCNGSACHGGVKGRGGFKLSAGALYPKEDYDWIVKGGTFQVLTTQVSGPRTPRIDLSNSEKSLLLLKPTGSVPHAGVNGYLWIRRSTGRSSSGSGTALPSVGSLR
jgi:hypothetical protein